VQFVNEENDVFRAAISSMTAFDAFLKLAAILGGPRPSEQDQA